MANSMAGYDVIFEKVNSALVTMTEAFDGIDLFPEEIVLRLILEASAGKLKASLTKEDYQRIINKLY
jgi:hypothetical protein